MKRTMYLCLMVALMSLVSCHKDDDDKQDQIVGKWYLIEEKTIVDGKENEDLLTECDLLENLDVKADGNLVLTYYNRDIDGNCYQSDSENIEWKSKDNKGNYTLTYIEDGNYTSEVVIEGDMLTESFFEGENGRQVVFVYVYKRKE